MRPILLEEHTESEPQRLSVRERDALSRSLPGLAIAPVPDKEDEYILNPGSTVGALEISAAADGADDGASRLSVLIRPKIGIPRLLSIACYAQGKIKFQPKDFNFEEELALPDVLARALASHALRAFSRGLLHGYRTEEESLHTVRGRIMFAEQIGRRFGAPLPVEVRYDDFTDDVLANRLVKAAAARLGNMTLRSNEARRDLRRIAAVLDNVSWEEFPPRAVPPVRFDRLNEHYRGVVTLSRIILRHGAFEAQSDAVRAAGFLMDMNEIFQEFVTTALREKLGVSAGTLCSDKELKGPRRIHLDDDHRVGLQPDLTLWKGGRCIFVGDAKYKRVKVKSVPNADLYQLLAYATALDLPGGLLIYAHGEAEPIVHQVRNAGKRLEIFALDMSGDLDDVLNRVGVLAQRVLDLCSRAAQINAAA